MTNHSHQLAAQSEDRELERRGDFCWCNVASNAGHKDVADSLVKHNLCWHSRIHTAQDAGEWRLEFGEASTLDAIVNARLDGIGHIACIAFLQVLECLVRRHWRWQVAAGPNKASVAHTAASGSVASTIAAASGEWMALASRTGPEIALVAIWCARDREAVVVAAASAIDTWYTHRVMTSERESQVENKRRR